MDYKICVIAPFPNLARTTEAVLQERASELNVNVQIAIGDSRDGVERALQAVERGAEVLISRGGTALAIASQIATVPVVEIQVTAVDVFHAIKQAGVDPQIIGIAGFRSVIYECERLADLLGVSIHVIPLDNMAETADKIAFAASKGIKVVIGDANSVIIAREMGLGGYVIESGKDAVYKAIKEAELVADVRRREQERAELLRTIVDSSTDGIVAIDTDNRITFFNPTACEIFRVKSANVIGRPVREVMLNTRLPEVLDSGIPNIGEIQHIGHKVLATKRIPIKIKNKVVGAIANFQDVTQLQQFEQTIRQKLHEKGLVAKVDLEQIIGKSAVLQAAKRQVRRYAAPDSTVLITGESGTGKEMFAQSIHQLSSRVKSPFVAINCAALPETLLESELMGYEEGAFTGAKKGGKQGLFELAHGGTIFLDEIGELPLALQARLLRVLQEKEVMRLGGHKVTPVDVRIIAATNQNLIELVAHKEFRADLYYRLNILRLHLPPLRNRYGDIPLLVEHFLRKLSNKDAAVKKLSEDAIHFLESLPWPGNIRELANILERTMVLSDSDEISADDIKEIYRCDLHSDYSSDYPGLAINSALAAEPAKLEDVKQDMIEQILREEDFNYTRAAKRLGISRTTLWRRMQKQSK
ncbi:sigma 54-interacting transcriptional regulator [Sporomusa aerivorans]|uniref:sigma 54-interacting transcriptional regulator n=1 Tax=Sporomusa aerivorans TaxID=204936 RepID=UPI003529DFC6